MNRDAIVSHISSHTIVNILANFFRVFIGGVVLIFVARKLGPSQYGIVSLGLSIAAITSLFCDFGVSTSTARFLAENSNSNSIIYQTGRTLNFFFSLIFSLLLLLLAKPISELVNIGSPIYIQIISLLTFSRGLFSFSLRSLQGIKKTHKIALSNFLHHLITSISIFIIAYLGYKATQILFCHAFSMLFVWVISLAILLKYFKIFEIDFNIQSLKKILLYALPLLLTSSSYFLLLRGPTVLLSSFTGTNEVSYLNIPLKVVELASLPAYSLAMVTAPFFTKKEKTSGNLSWLYVKILKYGLLFYLPIAIFLFMGSGRIINLVFGPEYENASKVLLILSLYLPFFSIATFTSRILDFLGLAKQKSIVFAATAGITIISSFIVIPALKELGAALVIAIPYTLFSIYTIIRSSKECGVSLAKYLRKLFNICIIIAFTCLPTGVILHLSEGYPGLILSFICFTTVFLGLTTATRTFRFEEIQGFFKALKRNK